MDNKEEMDKFLEKYNFPKLDQEDPTLVPIHSGSLFKGSRKSLITIQYLRLLKKNL